MPLRVLYVPPAGEAPSKVIRIVEPLQRLAAIGLVEPVPLGDAAPADLDAIFLHFVDVNRTSAPIIEPLVEHALRCGVAVILDADDPYFFGPDCGVEEDYAPHHAIMRRLCGMAHVVTVTTAALKVELAPYARAITVLPNVVDLAHSPRRPGAHARLRLGWSGGPTHQLDLAAFLPAVRTLQAQVDLDFVLFGLFDRDIADTVRRARTMSATERAAIPALAAFGRLADALEGVRFEHHPSVPFADFPARLAALDLDIGVCPLEDTRFNRCRSAVKFYQYAAAGTLTVASDVTAYRRECNLLAANSPDAWVDALLPLARDPGLRAQRLAEQRAFVSAQRSAEVGTTLYGHLFSRLCEAVRRTATR